jgi:hypothetical protein
MNVIVKARMRAVKIQTLLWGWSWCVVAYIGMQLMSGEGHFAWPVQLLLFAGNAVVALWSNPFRKGGVFDNFQSDAIATALMEKTHENEKG